MVLLLAAAMTGSAAAKPLAGSRPNIIVIYTDDQGYGDVSALNSEAKFQALRFDRLANEGTRSRSWCAGRRYKITRTGVEPARRAD